MPTAALLIAHHDHAMVHDVTLEALPTEPLQPGAHTPSNPPRCAVWFCYTATLLYTLSALARGRAGAGVFIVAQSADIKYRTPAVQPSCVHPDERRLCMGLCRMCASLVMRGAHAHAHAHPHAGTSGVRYRLGTRVR